MGDSTTRYGRLRQAFWASGLVLGIATTLLGIVVIFGWYTGNITLIQVLPQFVPMQYNTASGFVLAGSGLSLISLGRQKAARVAGFLAFAVGVLTLFEYVANADLGIDELFMKHDITVATSHPGRMAPNTAACFLLVGLALWLRPPGWAEGRVSMARVFLSSLAFGLSVVALAGYTTGLETAYGWGNLTRMAVHTSVGFMLVSTGVLAFAWSAELSDDTWVPTWLPVPTGFMIVTATLCFWQALNAESSIIETNYPGLSSLTELATVILIFGGLLAVAVSLAAYLAQRSGQRARQVERMNENLEQLVDERTRDADAARQEAVEANMSKSRFLANMSHELRTPMNAIIGYSEMLMEDADDDGREEESEDLRKIHGAGTHLLALINGILDLSKIEAGKMELYLETFDLPPFLEGVVATVKPLAQKNGNQLVAEFGEDLGSLRADQTKLRQCIFNLLSNAAKFTKQGTITLRVKSVTFKDEPGIRFEISDTGIGIPEDKIDKVFEEFSQADESTTRDYGGTGLGLPISKRFCEMMGGEISAESVVGEGSTFSMVLPRKVVEAPLQSEAERIGLARAAMEEGQRVALVIDDEAASRELIGRALEREDYSVIQAGNGEEGIRLAHDIKPDVITLDIMMPGVDGWEVLADLKGSEDVADIPVIMISVLEEKGLAFSLGATEFVRKPVNRAKLSAVLQAATGKSGGQDGVEALLQKQTGSPEELLGVLRELG